MLDLSPGTKGTTGKEITGKRLALTSQAYFPLISFKSMPRLICRFHGRPEDTDLFILGDLFFMNIMKKPMIDPSFQKPSLTEGQHSG